MLETLLKAVDGPEGAAAAPIEPAVRDFITGMLRRLVIGSARYGRRPLYDLDVDYTATAAHRLGVARDEGAREHLLDAANYCLLAWVGAGVDPSSDERGRHMAGGEHSPGNINRAGFIVDARGRYGRNNGAYFEW